MSEKKTTHRVIKSLCISAFGLFIMTLVLNLIPLGGEWASVSREWIENTIGLH